MSGSRQGARHLEIYIRMAKEAGMKDLLFFLIILGAWFFIQGWLLPKIGVST